VARIAQRNVGERGRVNPWRWRIPGDDLFPPLARRRVRALQPLSPRAASALAASLQAWHAHAASGTTARLRRDVARGALFRRPSAEGECARAQLAAAAG